MRVSDIRGDKARMTGAQKALSEIIVECMDEP